MPHKISLALPITTEEFAELLLDWYREHGRDLPWRNQSDPYLTWVSEIMLQQTQVSAVVPYFNRFISTYPTLEDLADADEAHVLESWSGLGYYSRARNLYRSAAIVLEKYGGRFPSDYSQALELPGIGRYSAGAILSIAYGMPLPVLDGNVRRVVSRYLAIEKETSHRLTESLWDLMTSIVEDRYVVPYVCDFNQALMELGALICIPKQPRCDRCPLAGSCIGREKGIERQLPVSNRRRSTVFEHFMSAVIKENGHYLMCRNESTSYLKGFWEFPKVRELLEEGACVERFQQVHGLKLKPEIFVPPVRHQVTFRRLTFHPFTAVLKDATLGTEFAWVKIGDRDYPLSAYIGKIIRSVTND